MGDESRIRVRFFTAIDKYRVTNTPFAVPEKLGRYGLSEVVNHLLGLSGDPIPFDFKIKDQLLRESLIKYVNRNNVSTESIIELEYFLAVSLNEESKTQELPAWVGCIDSSGENMILAGCYDGQLQIMNKSNLSILSSVSAHNHPIRAVCSSLQVVFTGSKDHMINAYDLSQTKSSVVLEKIGVFRGHINSVEALCALEDKLLFSGDWSGNTYAWNIKDLLHRDNSSLNDSVSKKQKNSMGGYSDVRVELIQPLFVLKSHAQAVTGLQVTSNQRLFTCSHDHSIKEWDIERNDCVTTFTGSKVSLLL